MKTLIRLGITPPAKKQTFSFTINPENLRPNTVVAYKSYAQDVEGNWGETDLKIFRVKSGKTTTTTLRETTSATITNIRKCIREGGACRLDEQCCSGFCSSGKCQEKLGVWWYLITLPVLIVVVLIIVWMKSLRKTEEDEFERLKEKWRKGGFQSFK